jgi:flagellar hook-basal body complex protein FliE
MREIDTSNMLAQLRANAALASGDVAPAAPAVQQTQDGQNFTQLLQQSINQVNELQQSSGDLSKSFELGDPNVSLAEVMIAKEKAGLAFESVLQVRNKLMEAYKEVMAMHV